MRHQSESASSPAWDMPSSHLQASCSIEKSMHPRTSTSAATPPMTPARSRSGTAESASPLESAVTNLGGTQRTHDGIIKFCPEQQDYEIIDDPKLGSGLYSSVHLAKRVSRSASQPPTDPLTPPITPTRSRHRQSLSNPQPELYAVKVALDKNAIRALRSEARILSLLTSCRDSRAHIVPFHGYDFRNDALVLTALPATLDQLTTHLNSLDPDCMATKLCDLLPGLGQSLISSLAWLHSHSVVHADVKPVNILLRVDYPISPPQHTPESLLDHPFHPLIADFTSSFLLSNAAHPSTHQPLGGGTYDYMAPELLSKPYPPPSTESDVYALAVTLLEIVIGASPFKNCNANRMRKLAIIKEGTVLKFVEQDETSRRRFRHVAKALMEKRGLDLSALLELGLRKDPRDRGDAASWSLLWRG